MLKFCIDYYSLSWFGSIQPIFLYLDFSYYLGSVSESSYQLVLILALIYMNLYWLITLSLFIMGKKMSTVTQNMKKVFFLLSKTILYMPLLNIVLRYSLFYIVYRIAAFRISTEPVTALQLPSFQESPMSLSSSFRFWSSGRASLILSICLIYAIRPDSKTPTSHRLPW